MEYIDLRSDTVTKPTPEMREAMAKAEVGDDVYGEDPTVNTLQELAAEKTGKEAGLFVASGTMGNLAAILTHCDRGDEVILGNKAHTFLFEAGGISALGGIHSHQLPNREDGSISLNDIEAAIRSDDPHNPITRLICLENSHNRCGGTVQSLEYCRGVGDLARSRGITLHLDGARIFNAAVALSIDVKELTRDMNSVTFCLSKGLCAPVGSVLCGSKIFIHKALRMRKMLGGGMRQAGILAAAGIIALEKMTTRLVEDHRRAKIIADALKHIPELTVSPPETNMVFVSLKENLSDTIEDFVLQLKLRGILVGLTGNRSLRMVLHYWIDDEGVERTITAFRDAAKL